MRAKIFSNRFDFYERNICFKKIEKEIFISNIYQKIPLRSGYNLKREVEFYCPFAFLSFEHYARETSAAITTITTIEMRAWKIGSSEVGYENQFSRLRFCSRTVPFKRHLNKADRFVRAYTREETRAREIHM